MDDRGTLPKHLQIGEMLVREIASGRLADGARLPSERQMASELNVAVGTLRRALDDLTERGLLERVQGSGNYVRQQGDARAVYSLFRLERPGGGGVPTALVLAADAVARPDDLGTEPGCGQVLRVRRLRYLDDIPAALEEVWVDLPGAAELSEGDLSGSLYLSFQRELGVTIDRTEDRVHIGKIPDWGGPQLGLPVGAACGYVTRTGWGQWDKGVRGIVEVSRTWFDGNRAHFVSRNK